MLLSFSVVRMYCFGFLDHAQRSEGGRHCESPTVLYDWEPLYGVDPSRNATSNTDEQATSKAHKHLHSEQPTHCG